jgi:hypothetical protein
MTVGAYYDYDSESSPTTATTTTIRPVVDAAVACIIGRELIEAVMFITSHVGAVAKHPTLTKEQRWKYLERLIPAVMFGFFFGLIITIAVAIPLSQQADKLHTAHSGVEIGEGISKTIAFFFVMDLTLRLPKWFGISKYIDTDDHKTTTQSSVTALSSSFKQQQQQPPPITTDDQEQIVDDIDKQTADTAGTTTTTNEQILPSPKLDPAWKLALSLFWNTFRESCEGGLLTAVTVILSQSPSTEIGASVGTGIAAAVILAIIFYLGAKYISAIAFGIFAAIIAQLLAMGLSTGAVREFEEAYASNHNGVNSGTIYEAEGATAYGLTSLEFMGWSGSLTAMTLATWLIGLFSITSMQIWHNVLGKRLVPDKKKTKRWFKNHWKNFQKKFCCSSCNDYCNNNRWSRSS